MFLTSIGPLVLSLKVVFRVSYDPTGLPELEDLLFGEHAFACKNADSTTLVLKGDEMNGR